MFLPRCVSGEFIRKLEGRTTVAARAKCHSACALIFIAGVERTNLGEIGLHRPYLDTDPELLKSHLPMLYAQVKAYVAEMGIGDGFVQKMMDTDSSKMTIYYSKDSLTLIPKYDPKYDEARKSHARHAKTVSAPPKCGSASTTPKPAMECVTRPGSPNASAPNSGA